MSDGPLVDVCSAKGCQAPAAWELLWNNPKLHTPDRCKTRGFACDEHRQSLGDFAARQFLRTSSRTPEVPVASSSPMADIGRSGWKNDGSSIPWPARFPRIADPPVGDLPRPRRRRQRRAQVGLPRANRQLRTRPSAVSRTRSQSPQKAG